MARKPFSVRLPDEVRDRLELHATETGCSMSDIVTEALANYFSISSPKSLSDRVSRIERQLGLLES